LAERKGPGTQVSKSSTGSDSRVSILGLDGIFKDLYDRWVFGTPPQNTPKIGVDRDGKP
jgi:hypothetical protein